MVKILFSPWPAVKWQGRLYDSYSSLAFICIMCSQIKHMCAINHLKGLSIEIFFWNFQLTENHHSSIDNKCTIYICILNKWEKLLNINFQIVIFYSLVILKKEWLIAVQHFYIVINKECILNERERTLIDNSGYSISEW